MKLPFKMMILAGALVASATFAQSPKSSYSITADVPFVSSYVFRGVELGRQAVQPSITYSSGNLSLGVWSNQPLTSQVDNEFDFFGGYDFALGADWKLNVGGTVYYYPQLDTSTGADGSTYEPKLALTGPLGPVSSTVAVYYDSTLKNTTLEGSLGYSLPMQGGGDDTVDFGAAYGRVTADVTPDYSYWSLSAKATFRPKENLSIYFGVVYASTDLTSERNHIYGTVGVSFALSRH